MRRRRPTNQKSVVEPSDSIYLFMNCGMTHLDTFDLKPGHSQSGRNSRYCNQRRWLADLSIFLPMIASQFDRLAVIRFDEYTNQ